jgi:hypothetical protein
VVARIHRKIAGFKRDEVYVGNAEERAAQSLSINPSYSKDADYEVKPGHMYPGVPAMPPNFVQRMHTLDDIAELERDLKSHRNDVDRRLKDLEVEKAKLQKSEMQKLNV